MLGKQQVTWGLPGVSCSPRADRNANNRLRSSKTNCWWEEVLETSRRDSKAKQGKDVGLHMVTKEEVMRLRALGSVTSR